MVIDRREFLKKAGLGSIGRATLPKVLDMLSTPALAQARPRFFALVALSGARTVEGVVHQLVGGERV